MGTDGAIAQLLREQDQIITRQQALSSLSSSAFRRRVRAGGPWQLILPGVAAAFTGVPTQRQRIRAALLYAGADAYVTGATACRLHRIKTAPTCAHVHVAIPLPRKRKSTGFVVIHRTSRARRTRCIEGFEVAGLPRALMDAALRLGSLDGVRALLAEGVQRGKVPLIQLIDELAIAPRRGSGHARYAVEELVLGGRSAPEGAAIRLARRSRVLPPGHHDCLVVGPDGVIGASDGYWEQAGVAQEVDSVDYHYDLDPWSTTMERRARYGAAGINVLPVRPRRLKADPAGVLRELESAYRIGVRKGPPPGIRVVCRPGCQAGQAA